MKAGRQMQPGHTSLRACKMADSYEAVHALGTFAGSDKSGSMQCEQCMLTACSARNAAWCAPTADKAQSLRLTESDVPLSDLQPQVCELVKLSLSALAVKILDCTRSCSGVVFVDCGPASLTDAAGNKATRCLHVAVAGHAFCAAYNYIASQNVRSQSFTSKWLRSMDKVLRWLSMECCADVN